jgi:hypothetical protein
MSGIYRDAPMPSVSGLNLRDPEQHHPGDLFAAMRKDAVVAATAELLPYDDPVQPHQSPPRHGVLSTS